MRKLFLLAFLLNACELDVTPDPGQPVGGSVAVRENALIQSICSPPTVFFNYMRTHEKTNNCYSGYTYLSDGSTTPTVYCWYQPANNAPRISRGLGLQRRGKVLANTKAYDIFACEFERCDIYDISVSCNCSYCYQIFPENGAQPQ